MEQIYFKKIDNGINVCHFSIGCVIQLHREYQLLLWIAVLIN